MMGIVSSGEPHFKVKDLATRWAVSEDFIRRLFRRNPGVVRIAEGAAGKRAYVSMKIPASVAEVEYRKLTAGARQVRPPKAKPPATDFTAALSYQLRRSRIKVKLLQ